MTNLETTRDAGEQGNERKKNAERPRLKRGACFKFTLGLLTQESKILYLASRYASGLGDAGEGSDKDKQNEVGRKGGEEFLTPMKLYLFCIRVHMIMMLLSLKQKNKTIKLLTIKTINNSSRRSLEILVLKK